MKKGDYIICPECKGKGKVFDHEEGIFTLGIGYLFGKVRCKRCKGSGFIKVH